MKRILVIGAGGFIGGFIVRTGLERGYEVTAGIRSTTSRQYLGDERIRFVELDYSDIDAMIETLRTALPEGERWDYVIYNLGATKCAYFNEYDKINYRYLINFITALKCADKKPERFLFMSSLSAMGPGDEKGYTPIRITDRPQPNTRYGLSKMKAEDYVRYQSGLKYIIFRATGVYGPHEKDYLMMIESIDKHIDVGMGYRKQLLTFIYVDDLVNAMYDALESGVADKTYIIAEPQAYTQREFRKMVAEELGRKFVLPLKLPMWAVYWVSRGMEKVAQMKGKTSTLNRDKFIIMRQRNWTCDVSDAINDFGFHVDYPLRRGLHETVKAYREDKKAKKSKKK